MKKQKKEVNKANEETLSKRESISGTKKTSNNTTSLIYLFLFLLDDYKVNIYQRNSKRNIYNRIYKAFCKTIINNKRANEFLYLCKEGHNYNFNKHQLVIGWGKQSLVKEGEKFTKIPLYSISDTSKLVYEHSIPSWIYKDLTSRTTKVNTGYWIFWRGYKNNQKKGENGKLFDLEVFFIPAEESTMIPVDSTDEETFLRYLLNKNINFKKPLIKASEDDTLPDFVLTNQEPKTIVEVTSFGKNADKEKDNQLKYSKLKYLENLERKRKIYRDKNINCIEWDGELPLDSINFQKGD